MSLAATLIQELQMESATTRRVLERVPDAKLGWAPHAKSRTLGQLAMHLASNPAGVTTLASQNPADLPDVGDVDPTSIAEVLAALDASVAEATRLLSGMSDEALAETWRARVNGVEIMALPRITFLRSVLLNHWYHHRGQLSVYLRLLDVPLPSIYGPSADENPFAA
ncbi:DinB family protein [Gemmatimonas sp.]|uniref:DinB family protein n=1 Tax=Gemmatimonas sp. TaxID=1962908 RepID=UPI00286C2CEC|nr:DinB family protein [Gemmatimonas sp.]